MKVKIELTLFKPLRHIGGVDVLLHSFFTAAVYGSEWLTLRLGRFSPRKERRCPLNGRLSGFQFWCG